MSVSVLIKAALTIPFNLHDSKYEFDVQKDIDTGTTTCN